ncbi:UDP-N-acetylmuramoyl-L-alanyl-D-glutamate--2,6-diaminopimelate ligase [Candidatus Saccharibacteria bacterium]|nr:UDP-N-acetylmuramoyl-L-alanyl-D-glutamate--2,6-diaminopimelate ligase [Candidatus Saccharibacteria bacterium]
MREKLQRLRDWLLIPYHYWQGVFWALVYGFPTRGMTVIGVTGTNGKTTTSFMIYEVLRAAGKRVGILTTVSYGANGRLTTPHEHATTPHPRLLNQRLRALRKRHIDYLVLETTSHALAQNRIWGIKIDSAVLTNMTHEHLDYHGTFERYMEAKRKLFLKAEFGIVNAEDEVAPLFLASVPHSMTFGVDAGDLRASNIKLESDSVQFALCYRDFCANPKMPIRSNIAGEFNVYNALAAAAVGLHYGLNLADIAEGISNLDSVDGRMEVVDVGQPWTAIIDYAHTPDAFAKLLPDMKKAAKKDGGRLIVLFGSAGGRRDPSKRAPQGELAGQYADVIILTEEDDRGTPAEEIFGDIEEGISKTRFAKKNLYKIEKRPEAIEFAVEMARRNDVVLFLGKGHERTLERAEGDVKYYELDYVRRALKRRFASGNRVENKK